MHCAPTDTLRTTTPPTASCRPGLRQDHPPIPWGHSPRQPRVNHARCERQKENPAATPGAPSQGCARQAVVAICNSSRSVVDPPPLSTAWHTCVCVQSLVTLAPGRLHQPTHMKYDTVAVHAPMQSTRTNASGVEQQSTTCRAPIARSCARLCHAPMQHAYIVSV